MPCRTLFISQEDFKDRVNLSDNVLSKYIIPSIALVQDRHIRKILCNDFYNELIEQLEDDTVTTANQTLIDDYIKPAMVYRSYARYVATANVFSSASGMRKYLEQDSEPATSADLASIIGQAESDALFYERELYEFLEDNEDDYPTYRDNCKCGKVKSITNFKISKVGKGFRKDMNIDPYYNPYDPFYNDYLDDHGKPK
jgi:hypothetical protein